MADDRATHPGTIAATILDDAYQEDQERRWSNIEELLDKAITEVMFNDGRHGTPSLGVLIGTFRTPNAVPDAATEAAHQLEELVGENDCDAAELIEERRDQLSDALVAFLRFVCHRGDEP